MDTMSFEEYRAARLAEGFDEVAERAQALEQRARARGDVPGRAPVGHPLQARYSCAARSRPGGLTVSKRSSRCSTATVSSVSAMGARS